MLRCIRIYVHDWNDTALGPFRLAVAELLVLPSWYRYITKTTKTLRLSCSQIDINGRQRFRLITYLLLIWKGPSHTPGWETYGQEKQSHEPSDFCNLPYMQQTMRFTIRPPGTHAHPSALTVIFFNEGLLLTNWAYVMTSTTFYF